MTLDHLLVVLLVIVLPGYMLTRSLKQRGTSPGGDRVRRYRRTLLLVGVPLLAVSLRWVTEHRPAAALGLAMPDRTRWALIGVAALLIGALAYIGPRAKRPSSPARHAAAAAMLPVGRRETAWFVAFALAVGIGWEVLYRGYLWWTLAPAVGAIGAVAIMAVSYGVAHGYRGPGPLVASIVSALLFAIGYALTGSLWWLMVIHVGLPLVSLRVRPDAAA